MKLKSRIDGFNFKILADMHSIAAAHARIKGYLRMIQDVLGRRSYTKARLYV